MATEKHMARAEEHEGLHLRIRTTDEVLAKLPQVFPSFEWGRIADSCVLVGGLAINFAFTIKGWLECPPCSTSTCMKTWCTQEAQRVLAYGELFYMGCGFGAMALTGLRSRSRPAAERWRAAAEVGCDFVSLSNYTAFSLIPRIKTGCTSASKQKDLEERHMRRGGTALEYAAMALRTFAFSVTDISVGLVGLAGLQIKLNTLNFWPNSFLCFGLYGAFMNQLVGMVDVERLKITMVYRVLFAGEDSTFSRENEETMMNFQADLLRGLCELHGNFVGTFLFLTSTSEDLQLLVLDDSARRRDAESGAAERGTAAGAAVSSEVAKQESSWWYMDVRSDMFLSQAIQFFVRR